MQTTPEYILRNLSDEEIVHRFDSCGDPTIEYIVKRLAFNEMDCECEYADRVESLENDLGRTLSELHERSMHNDKLVIELQDANDLIEKLRQQVRNLGEIPS